MRSVDDEALLAVLSRAGIDVTITPAGLLAQASSEAEGMEISTTTLEMLEGLAGRKL